MTATCNVMVSCWIKYTKLAKQWQALKPAKKSNTKMKGNQSTPNPTQVFLLHAKWLGNLPRRGREQYTTMFQALPTYLPIHPFIHWPPQSLAWRKWNRLENRLRHLQQDLLGASKLSELVSQLGHPRPNRTHFWFKKRVIQTKASNVWIYGAMSMYLYVKTYTQTLHLSIYLSTYLPYTYLSIYLSIHRPIDRFIDLSIYTHCITLLLIAVVPHKVVAEVSKIGSL